MKCRMIMTVVFDKPFYKGVFECFADDRYAVAEINLGTSLPKTRDIYRLVLKRWNTIHFSKETLDSTRVKRSILKECNGKLKNKFTLNFMVQRLNKLLRQTLKCENNKIIGSGKQQRRIIKGRSLKFDN